MNILNDSLKECVKKIRSICYKTHDLMNAEVINNLKNAQGISYFEDLKRDQFGFYFPTTPLQTKFFYPEERILFKD
jgi:hypothetical protein